MKGLGYYLQQNQLAKGFIARTVLTNTYSDEEFIEEMCKKDTAKSANEIKEILKLLIETADELLAGGNSIVIPNFLKISPVVKGTFQSVDESFDPSKHWVGINCTVSNVFIDDFQKEVKVEKVNKPSNWPEITMISDNKTKQNVIQKDYANQISGENLVVAGYDLEGINITDKNDMNQSVLIKAGELDIINHKSRELLFTITRNYQAPVWLVGGKEILVKLRYADQSGLSKESEFFESKWVV